jgi:predicted ATPase
MISKWGVSNFKSIATTRVIDEDGNETNDFIFKPLTILCGANSSGKSSLLQSLLLMAQTMRHPNKDIPLILNGAFTNLGKFNDIKSNMRDNKEIQMRFSYKPSDPDQYFFYTSFEYPFEHESIDETGSLPLPYFDLPPFSIKDTSLNYAKIKDSSFSINFFGEENEILPKLSHFEISIFFDSDDSDFYILKYYNNGQSKKLKRLFYKTDKDGFYATAPSFFNQVFGSNPKVGDKVTLLEVFKKTSKGVETMLLMRERWEAAGIFVDYAYNKDSIIDSEYVIKSIAKKTRVEDTRVEEIEVNNILQDEEEYELLNHFLPMNIKINGMRLISKMALENLFSAPYSEDLPYLEAPPAIIIEPDEAKGYLYRYALREASPYYVNNITKNLFFYLKDELLSGIQGIDNLFLDYKFTHDIQGYPHDSWWNNFRSLQQSTQFTIGNVMENEIYNIYEKIHNDLSNIKEIISKNSRLYSEMCKNAKQNKDSSKDIIKCSNCLFADDFKGKESCGKCFFNTDFTAAKKCYDFFDYDFMVSKKIEKFLSDISSHFFLDISYLGPLRENPKMLYPINDSSYTNDIGKKGENTAAMLALYGENKQFFPVPEQEASGISKTEEKSLKEAIIEWLEYIGVAKNIEAKIEQGGFTLRIETLGSSHLSDLTNVGVGVSQVLPIVVMCLSAKKGATLIIEQPELHLHPKMQTKLTEFFIAVSQSGKQCIIETHSEHIINALRYQVAKAEAPHDKKLADDIQIYFAEKDENGSLFRSITMDKYAYISEWPENFFDEAQISNINTLKAINKKMEKDPPSE